MRVLVTGAAGFIGYHLSALLLGEGHTVHGYDGLTDYYDVSLKQKRLEMLGRYPEFSFTEGMLESEELLSQTFGDFEPEVVVHLAAQAGVRYSLENPRAYIDSNIVGTFNVMESSKHHAIKHLLMASTSSVYGANKEMPFVENHKADTQLTIYAATKKATESMGHSYAYLHNLPTTMFRFFTVYGPWGRPDMALFKFTKGLLTGVPIDVYNGGDMYRDFTYIDDLVVAIRKLINFPPLIATKSVGEEAQLGVAPFRVVNIGNSEQVKLSDFIDAIEAETGKEAIRNNLPIQVGDVPATWADTTLLKNLTGFSPKTSYKVGVHEFVRWFRSYYQL